jgi:hypothetical protein
MRRFDSDPRLQQPSGIPKIVQLWIVLIGPA